MRILTSARDAFRRDPIVWSTVAILALLFLSTASRYDTFRNELYFIACGRHPASATRTCLRWSR